MFTMIYGPRWRNGVTWTMQSKTGKSVSHSLTDYLFVCSLLTEFERTLSKEVWLIAWSCGLLSTDAQVHRSILSVFNSVWHWCPSFCHQTIVLFFVFFVSIAWQECSFMICLHSSIGWSMCVSIEEVASSALWLLINHHAWWNIDMWPGPHSTCSPWSIGFNLICPTDLRDCWPIKGVATVS